MNYKKRIEATRSLMAERGIDVLLIGQPANRRYLSGFVNDDESSSASAAWIVLTPTSGFFVTTFLYFEAVANALQHLEPVRAKSRLVEGLVDVLKQTSGDTIVFEATWVTTSVHDKIAEALGGRRTLKPADGLVETLRQIKDAEEMAILRRAFALTDRVYAAVVSRIRPGQTEREIAWLLEKGLREGGAQGMAFGPDVAAGKNSAVPHHRPTDYALREGEPIWIDMGAKLDGYCADLTRSFCIGSAGADYLEAYDLVQRAQTMALERMRPGVTGKEADALARDVIVAAGRGDEFGHSLGHGVGLDIHEAPSVGRLSEDTLRAGMVVTVEPGVYRPGWGGIRIEDVVLIGDGRPDVLTNAPKQPIIRGA